MKLIFRDLNPAVVAAASETFADVPRFTGECCNIFANEVRAGAIISPANCVGRMDGGIDAAYLQHFGWQLQARLCHHLIQSRGGRIEIGEATFIATLDPSIPYMIMAPTMDWPPGDVRATNNAYLAFRAALRTALKLGLDSLLTPGLCTLTGRMAPVDCARQMRSAWDEVLQIN